MAARTGAGRTAIIKAGYQLIAELGYPGATTALICARAGVSSGTFFHYFPTKVDLLLGILDADADDSHGRAERSADASSDADTALSAWLDALLEEASDPHFAGFVAALGTAPSDPRLDVQLARAASGQRDALTAIVSAGQQQGIWRTDLEAGRLALWVGVIADGVLARRVEDSSFDTSSASRELRDLIARYLAP
ncbi:TetR/AcrR family transcriptional regulator [Pseudoclavibacter helvolus]|uniref:TetR/AcrR family transcriptional regulator n=1 Tax=Pseudoclavibacter helvolus TaxID=255205 RepID=UPI003C756D3D